MRAKAIVLVGLVTGLGTSFSLTARADMVLTAAGSADFTLSTFIGAFPNGGVPQGIAFPTSGGVMVTDASTGAVSVFADTDGQPYSAGVIGGTYSSGANGLVSSLSGQIYMTQQGVGNLVKLNNDGSSAGVVLTGLGSPIGLATNPVSGMIYISNAPGNGTIYQYNPVTNVKTTLVADTGTHKFDGLAVSADGKTLYAADWGGTHNIYAIDTTTGALTDLGNINNALYGNPDGLAIGLTGSIAGDLFVNTNGGDVIEINLTTDAQTLIATGGTRGDFVAVDPNGTLLLTQFNDILRLSPVNGSFAVPGPVAGAGLPGLILASGGLFGWWRRKRKAQAVG